MIIINSGAYVESEFQSEVGLIPPSFLPLGNKKLLESQILNLRSVYNEKIFISLPKGYILTLNETKLLTELDVTCVRTPDEFTLGQSIVYILNSYSIDGEPVRLLHGDTLPFTLPEPDVVDVIGVVKSEAKYNWVIERLYEGEDTVWCGFFVFSSKFHLVRALTLSRGDFYGGIKEYRSEKGMKPFLLTECYDLGHINTYFQSRSKITTQRAFNLLKISNGVLTKRGSPDIKIVAEANWFKQIPAHVKKNIPQLLDDGIDDENRAFYCLEYLPMLPLNELFVHGRNPVEFWAVVFGLINEFLQNCSQVALTEHERKLIANDAVLLYEKKTFDRLNTYASKSDIGLDVPVFYKGSKLPSINDIAKECISQVLSLPSYSGILHGDLCLSNILYDSRLIAIKVIDPRGLDVNENLTIFGDSKYDFAKLTHSIMGLYDFIIAGRYSIVNEGTQHVEIVFDLDERLQLIQQKYMQLKFTSLCSVLEIMPLTVLLFLSMLPLHADRPDRQKAMLINALRLYANYVNKKEAK